MAAQGTNSHLAADLLIEVRRGTAEPLHRQVEASIAKGARSLLGAAIPNLRGAYYPPTVLTDVAKGMPAYEEELFGPVASVIPVADEEHAIRIANDSVYGLGGCLSHGT